MHLHAIYKFTFWTEERRFSEDLLRVKARLIQDGIYTLTVGFRVI